MNLTFVKKLPVVLVGFALSSVVVFAADNTDVGDNAGANQGDGANENVNIGVNAGNANVSGDYNVFLGKDAGLLNTTHDNTFLGYKTGAANVTGTDNVFVGTRAGLVNTATDNTFVGADAGLANTTGQDNTFIGEEAGEDNTEGRYNTFVGQDSGKGNTTGYRNTLIGNMAGGGGYGDLTGHNNTGVGEGALEDVESTGSRNTSIGSGAGNDIGEAYGNTMLGADAGANTEHADFSTFVGSYAGWDNNRNNHDDDANRNTALGSFSGFANREGSDNVWIGEFSNSQSSVYSYDSRLETDAQSAYNGISSQPSTGNLPGGNLNVNRSTVLGAFAGANDNDSVSIGYAAISDRTNSVTIGSNASGKGQYDLTVGDSATNTGNYAITMGYQAASTHSNAVTIGYGTTSRSDDTVIIGNATTTNWEPAEDNSASLGRNKHCYYDDYDHGGTYEWVCDPMYRFSDVVSHKFSAIAADTQMVEVDLWADNGDDFADQWSLSAADNGNFAIASYVNSTSNSRSETRIKTDLLTIENNGNATISGGLTLNSDKRLKKDINPIPSALNLIQKIEGVTYFWKDDLGRDKEKQYGLIAQNVEAVIPELVKENKQGTKSVNYQALIPVLINATQEQQKQIDDGYQQWADIQKR